MIVRDIRNAWRFRKGTYELPDEERQRLRDQAHDIARLRIDHGCKMMTPGAYIDAIYACLGNGLTPLEAAQWLQRKSVCDGSCTRLEMVFKGQGVYVLAEAARQVDGMVAT